MRLLVDLFGWTLDLTLTPTSDEPADVHDHLAGTFEVAPSLPVGEDDTWYDGHFGFRK